MKLIYNDDLSLVIIMSAKEKTEQEAFLNALLDEEINEPDQVLYILRMIERSKSIQ